MKSKSTRLHQSLIFFGLKSKIQFMKTIDLIKTTDQQIKDTNLGGLPKENDESEAKEWEEPIQ